MRVIADHYREGALTAAHASTLQEFRDLFSSEILRPDLQLGIQNLAILFTDLKESTAMYDRMVRDPRIAIGSPIVVHGARPDVIQYADTSLHFICEAVNPYLDRPLAERGTDARDIGVASTCALLLDRVSDECRRLHIPLLVLDTAIDNSLGQRFYFRYGMLARGLRFSMPVM